ncbi:hypothetical protein Ddye_029400 [Dipteronia dyeriana]|uniref:RNase H type-1 domain-containing protein n=1 Tax=Dipteronia dyeriana TaxID=168575 RepID=A0AAD9WLS5_9ROSI|nr:hypothetical protein Ddye_029400 [Dipteronia dyeriana]
MVSSRGVKIIDWISLLNWRWIVGEWIVELVGASFVKDDKDVILSLPIGFVWSTYSLLWHFDKSGQYTACSKYEVGCNLVPATSSSTSNKLESWWKSLWRLRIPVKVKVFILKSYHNWLLKHVCLCKREISVVLVCSICKQKPKSIVHALWGCSSIKFAINVGLFPTVFESDAKSVVDLVNLGASHAVDIGVIINDILSILRCYPVFVSFVPRQANSVAHTVAKSASFR